MFWMILALLCTTPATLADEEAECLGGITEKNCFTSFDEIAFDLDNYGKSISELANLSRAGEGRFDVNEVGEPTKPLTLRVLEEGVQSNSSLANTPIGYLTRYGYVRGILSATCGTDNQISGEIIVNSMITFTHAAQLDRASVFIEMEKDRCSQADITFDEDGDLDESSAKLILSAIGDTDDAAKLRSLKRRRKRRYAIHDNGKGNIGADKSEYTFKLHNTAEGKVMPYATDRVDAAFRKWSDAIGTALTFTSAHDQVGDADFNLRFVPDIHEDFTFSGNELAHAPYPATLYHANVHFRETRAWGDGDDNQLNFLYVTVHELGHLLGLKHSDVSYAIMQPIIDSETIPATQDVDLSDDEKLGIKVLYGEVSANCEDGWTGFDGMCFIAQTVSAGITWEDALLMCEAMDGRLVSVTDGVINSFIATNVANGRTPFWIGRKSTDDGWVNGEPFGTYVPENTQKLNPKKVKCLRTAMFAGKPLWEYISCSATNVEHYLCEKEEREILPTTQPPSPTSPPPVTPDRENVPCQNYIRAALRRSNYMYIFGTTMFYKYYYTNKRPLLQPGYPKYIRDHFEGIHPEFTAVVNDPYNKKKVYFLLRDEVYEWILNSKRDSIEIGHFKPKRGEPRKMKKVFKTTNTMRGAMKFDPNSIFLFGTTGEIGRWYRTINLANGKNIGKYDVVDKWDYFDSNVEDIDAVTDSYFNNYAIFFKNDAYFLLRKSDGRMPKKFRRTVDPDFDKLTICDVVAPLSVPYPDSLNPDEALNQELDNLA